MQDLGWKMRREETTQKIIFDNIRMDLLAIAWKGVNWFHVAQDRDQWRVVVNTVMNLLVP
jgi:hypothetical protein